MEEVNALKKALQASHEDRNGLYQQVEKLWCEMGEMEKERIALTEAVTKAQKETAELQMTWCRQQENVDSYLVGCIKNTMRCSEELKTLNAQSVELVAEHGKEVALLRARIDGLLIEKVQLEEELKLYKEDRGVIALD